VEIIKEPIIFQQARYSTKDLSVFVENWGQWIRNAPREMTSFLMISKGGRAGYTLNAMNVWAGANQSKALPVLEAAMNIDQVVQHNATLLSYPEIVPTPNDIHRGQQKLRFRNGLVNEADGHLGKAIADTLINVGVAVVELRSLGGAVNDVPTHETAWSARHQEAFVSAWIQPMVDEAEKEAFQPLQEIATGNYGAYSSDLSQENAELTWSGVTGEKLKKIAETVDSTGLFDQGLTIRIYS